MLVAEVPGQLDAKDACFLDSLDPPFLCAQDPFLEDLHEAPVDHFLGEKIVVLVTSLCQEFFCVFEKALHGLRHQVPEIDPCFGPLQLRSNSKTSFVYFWTCFVGASREHDSYSFAISDAFAFDATAELSVGICPPNAFEFENGFVR